MHTLCFGGSFNPIHYGHLRISEAVANKIGYEKVLLIPSAQPPHKPDSADLAPADDRLAMCRLAVAGSARFEVTDLEIRRPGFSYTFDTVQELRSAGLKSVNWLIGADMLRILPTWHRARELLAAVHFVIVARPDCQLDWQNLPPEYQFLKEHVVAVPQVDISATEIRRRIHVGESIEGLTPPAIAQYIIENHLYR
jgi:nicotinate-nucleotide adenylyltransferase